MTWLYRITVNLSLNHLKAKQRKERWKRGEEWFTQLLHPTDKSPNPQQQLEQQEQDRQIAEAIDTLSDKQRTAFVLSRYDELSQREVAEIMQTTEGAVEQLLIRARTNLQKKLSRP